MGHIDVRFSHSDVYVWGLWEDMEWVAKINELMAETNLPTIDWSNLSAQTGGRYGKHTEHLAPLLTEMGEVINSEAAEIDW